MNLALLAPPWLFAALAALLVAAALEDLIRLRISNILCLLVALGAIAAAVIAGPTLGLWQNALVCALLLGIGTFAFGRGWMGGGDVKMLAALGLWTDLGAAPALLAAIGIAGGLAALVSILSRLVIPAEGSWKKRQIPYGVAIAIGAIALFLLQRR